MRNGLDMIPFYQNRKEKSKADLTPFLYFSTTTQETLLNEIAKDLEEAKRDLGDHDEFKKIFVTQLANDDLDEKYLRKETARLIQGLENASETFITDLGAFHASLSDEQKEKLVDLANHKQGHRRWRN